MKLLPILLLLAQITYAQHDTLRFRTNYDTPEYHAYANKLDRIYGIDFLNDTTFSLFCDPDGSCFTWHHIKGKMRKDHDTLYLYDHYELGGFIHDLFQMGDDADFAIPGDFSTGMLTLNFIPRDIDFATRRIQLTYYYKKDTLTCDYHVPQNNRLEIPVKKFPLGAQPDYIRLVYTTDNSTTPREVYLYFGPGTFNIYLISAPEQVTRTIKVLRQGNRLDILSVTQPPTILPNHRREIKFFPPYKLVTN